MKYLFVSHYSATPHFETELELMVDLLEAEHEVYTLRCTGQLGACLLNPEHKAGWCKICVSKIDRGLLTIRRPRLHLEFLRPRLPEAGLQAEFSSLEELRSYCFDGVNLGRGVASDIAGRMHLDVGLDTRRFATEIRAELQSAYDVFVAVEEALERICPDRVYIFNGRFSTCYPILLACERANVEYCTHERGGTPAKYLLRVNALPHDIAATHQEVLELWGDGGAEKVETSRRWFRQRRDGADQSWPSYTKTQTEGRLPAGFDGSRRNLAIFTSTMEEYASVKGWENPLYPDEVVGLRKIVESLESADWHIYMRVHPNLKAIPRKENYQLREYAKLEGAKNLTIIWPESAVHTYALLDACDVSIVFASTVGVEACFWKRPCILAGHAFYEGLACAYRPQSHDELIDLLQRKLEPMPEEGALKYAYWEGNRGIPYSRFKPTGFFSGRWMGRPLRSSLAAWIQWAFLMALRR